MRVCEGVSGSASPEVELELAEAREENEALLARIASLESDLVNGADAPARWADCVARGAISAIRLLLAVAFASRCTGTSENHALLGRI